MLRYLYTYIELIFVEDVNGKYWTRSDCFHIRDLNETWLTWYAAGIAPDVNNLRFLLMIHNMSRASSLPKWIGIASGFVTFPKLYFH